MKYYRFRIVPSAILMLQASVKKTLKDALTLELGVKMDEVTDFDAICEEARLSLLQTFPIFSITSQFISSSENSLYLTSMVSCVPLLASGSQKKMVNSSWRLMGREGVLILVHIL